ncbi:MAG: methyltransferase domain-containing protein [bacterium]|nr:methyltransferase domain-containing protein [bacterium]
MDFIGGGDFETIGKEFFNHFTGLCHLKPGERVLEVGCGLGRIAVPMVDYLKDGGSYEGFDIVKSGITWCRKNITPRAPNFRFQVADVYNYAYHPNGRYPATRYEFPYEDGTFDFVFLTSVFTHMVLPDMENYLSQISRVLKKDGRCFITFFLLNEESLALVEKGASAVDFKYEEKGYRIMDPANPEIAVAYPEKNIMDLFKKNGMAVETPVRYGSWCGRKTFASYQDMVIAKKENAH